LPPPDVDHASAGDPIRMAEASGPGSVLAGIVNGLDGMGRGVGDAQSVHISRWLLGPMARGVTAEWQPVERDLDIPRDPAQ